MTLATFGGRFRVRVLAKTDLDATDGTVLGISEVATSAVFSRKVWVLVNAELNLQQTGRRSR